MGVKVTRRAVTEEFGLNGLGDSSYDGLFVEKVDLVFCGMDVDVDILRHDRQ